MPRGTTLTILAWLILLQTGSSPASADSIEKQAQRFVEAHAAQNAKVLADLIAERGFDGWLVAEQLCIDKATEAAKALVALMPRDVAYKKLGAYVAWRLDKPVAPEVLRQWKAATEAAERGDTEAALKLLDDDNLVPDGVTQARWLTQRATWISKQVGVKPEAVISTYKAAAQACNEMGWLHAASARWAQAIRVARRARLFGLAVELANEALRAASATKLESFERAMHGAATLAFLDQGKYEQALPHAERAFELAQTLPERRRTLNLLLVTEIRTDRRHAVRRHLPIMHEIEIGSGNQAAAASIKLLMASTDALLGNLTRALARLNDATAFFEARGQPRELFGLYKNAAQIWLQLRDGPRARENAVKAREIGESLGMDDGVVDLFEGVAFLFEENFKEAERVFRAALPKLGRMSEATRIGAHLNLAITLTRQDRHADAQAQIGAARALLKPTSQSLTRLYIGATECLLRMNMGDRDGAIEAGERARQLQVPGITGYWDALVETRLARAWMEKDQPDKALEHAARAIDVILKLSSTLPDRLGAHHRAELESCFAWGIEAAATSGDVARCFELAEQASAVALRGRLGEGELKEHALSPAFLAAEARLEEVEWQAVRDYRSALKAKDREGARRALTALEAARSLLEQHREGMRAQQAVAAQVLSPHVDQLAEVRKRLTEQDALVVYAGGARGLWALVVTSAEARLVALGSRERAEQLVLDSLLEDAGTPANDETAALVRALVTPLGIPARAQRVRIVPTGPIAWAPFAALLPDKAVTVLPSVTVARLLGEASAVAGTGVLAVGTNGGLAAPLPGAETEAQVVGDTVLVGEAATEGAVRKAVASRPRWRAVHMACHGLVDPVHPLRSALGLYPSKGRDGLWTVSEILGMRVPTDLVTLSACSTAKGRVFRQEGVLGFVHAFFVAGAQRVLVSLWDVDDKATAELMRRFHEAWKQGGDAATALRTAQASIRAEPRWKHPAYWAAWQLWGQP